MKQRRMLLIGLDAGDPELLLRGMEEGELPQLRSLRDQGAWGDLDFIPGFGSGAVWPSFATGVTPARHGRYFYRQVGPGDYEAARFHPRDFRARTFWEQLSAAGRRVAVLDVPKLGLSEELNGIEVVDWLVHGPVYKELRTQPESLAAELAERFGLDPLPQCDLPGGRNADQHAELLEILLGRIGTRTRASRELLRREPWDLFVTVFAEPHCVGHQCWHLRDPQHPLHDAEALARLGDPVRRVYREIDRAIGELCEEADEDMLVAVVSCTGMGPNYTGNRLLDEILRRLDGERKPVALGGWSGLKSQAKRVLPVSLRRRWRQTSRRVDERMAHADRRRRRFYSVPHNDIAGAVRVNLVGREPAGRVRPEELDALFESLRRDLLELRNLETGEPVVEDLARVADRCGGDSLEQLPDFFVVWKRDAPIERVGSAKVGELLHRHRGNRTGDHRPESIFFARGSGVVPGRVSGASVLDFAPTIATYFGVDPGASDGRVIAELCGGVETGQPEERLTG